MAHIILKTVITYYKSSGTKVCFTKLAEVEGVKGNP